MTLYEFDNAFEDLMDKAVNDLSPKQFKRFMDDISMMLSDYEDYEQEDEWWEYTLKAWKCQKIAEVVRLKCITLTVASQSAVRQEKTL